MGRVHRGAPQPNGPRIARCRPDRGALDGGRDGGPRAAAICGDWGGPAPGLARYAYGTANRAGSLLPLFIVYLACALAFICSEPVEGLSRGRVT